MASSSVEHDAAHCVVAFDAALVVKRCAEEAPHVFRTKLACLVVLSHHLLHRIFVAQHMQLAAVALERCRPDTNATLACAQCSSHVRERIVGGSSSEVLRRIDRAVRRWRAAKPGALV